MTDEIPCNSGKSLLLQGILLWSGIDFVSPNSPQVTVSKSVQHYRLEMIAEENFQAGIALPLVQLLSHIQRKFMENMTLKSLHLLVKDFKDK